jgi:branched-chain amino acid transport system ATP-binding protein
MTAALETIGLEKRFGGIVAATGLNLRFETGRRYALIGPNGAGKTTVINLLAGALRPDRGRILLGGVDVAHLPPHRHAAMGLARTFQINQLFADMTPLESVGIAVAARRGAGMDWFGRRALRTAIADEAAAILARFRLDDVMHARTRALPYGRQRALEIALALACRPRVLLLDEPAAGIPEAERHELLAVIAALPTDVTVVLVEHDMNLVFSFADRIMVLAAGAPFAEGTPQAIAADPRVRAIYLGEGIETGGAAG